MVIAVAPIGAVAKIRRLRRFAAETMGEGYSCYLKGRIDNSRCLILEAVLDPVDIDSGIVLEVID